MVPEVKVAWLEALRSGEYQKTTGRLARKYGEDTVGYCCLGVLTDLASKEGVCPPFTEVELGLLGILHERQDSFGQYNSASTTYLPPQVEDWSGVDEGVQAVLANINDTNLTFEEVIEYIDTNL